MSKDDPKGGLCGKGDISILSLVGTGEEDGTGGVVSATETH